jgi:hypothetical protein
MSRPTRLSSFETSAVSLSPPSSGVCSGIHQTFVLLPNVRRKVAIRFFRHGEKCLEQARDGAWHPPLIAVRR